MRVILAFINGEHNVHGCVYACMTGESISVRVVCVIVDIGYYDSEMEENEVELLVLLYWCRYHLI